MIIEIQSERMQFNVQQWVRGRRIVFCAWKCQNLPIYWQIL